MVHSVAGYWALGLAVLAVLAVWVLACKWVREKSPPQYFTWFLLHFGIGVVGIAAVVALALFRDLSGAAAAILASIVAYSVGASTHGAIAEGKGGTTPPPPGGVNPPPPA